MAMSNYNAEKERKAIEKEKERRLKAIENHNADYLKPEVNNDLVLLEYKKAFNKNLGLAKQKNWDIDLSKLDFAATKDLLKQGYRSDLIEKSIIDGSPNLDQRKGQQHMAEYARITVQNAVISKDVIDYRTRVEQAQRSGPEVER
jgi:hypothetical protein